MGLVEDAEARLLLVRTERRGWEPPGGQVELGEDLVTALRREIREESGCEVEVGALVGIYSNTGPPEKVMFTFRCRYTEGRVSGGDECLEAGWFAPDEAQAAVTHPAQAGKLQDALASGRAGITYRAYRTRPEYVVLGEWKC